MSEARPLSPQQRPEIWDTVAPSYAAEVSQWTDYAREALRIAALDSSDRILDLATGPGTLALEAASLVRRVDAVDFSPGMIEELRARAARENRANVFGAVMDASALAFEDAAFQSAFCIFGFMFFPDRALAFRELHRVLVPGGRLTIATWAPIERRPLMKVAFEAAAEAMPQAPRPTKGDLQDRAECTSEMSAPGFRDVVARTVGFDVRFESAESYLDAMIRAAAPLAAMKKTMPAPAFDAVREKLLVAVRARVPEGPFELGAEAILTTGVRGT